MVLVTVFYMDCYPSFFLNVEALVDVRQSLIQCKFDKIMANRNYQLVVKAQPK